MDNWYVMSVWTGKKNFLIKNIRTYNMENSINNVSPFVPMRETFFKRSINIKTETSILFPGYLFIETSMNVCDFINYIRNLRRTLNNSMTVLHYGDSGEIAIRQEEQLVLMKLMNHEWCVKTSLGFKENNIVTITDGPLVGYEGKIKKIDRHKMNALLEVDIIGKKSLIELGLHVIRQPDIVRI